MGVAHAIETPERTVTDYFTIHGEIAGSRSTPEGEASVPAVKPKGSSFEAGVFRDSTGRITREAEWPENLYIREDLCGFHGISPMSGSLCYVVGEFRAEFYALREEVPPLHGCNS